MLDVYNFDMGAELTLGIPEGVLGKFSDFSTGAVNACRERRKRVRNDEDRPS